MDHYIEKLFLHLFIVLFIPFVHSFLKMDGKRNNSDYLFFGALFLSLLLSMLFPIRITDTLTFDMKFIPVFVAFLYLDKKLGILLAITICLFKWISGEPYLIMSIINYTIISLLFFYLSKVFTSFSLRRKILVAFVLYLIISVTRFFSLIEGKLVSQSLYLFSFTIFSFIILALVIYLLEMNQYHDLMRQKLQHADKLNAISQLAASVAHEIRNPMTTIRGFMQLLQNEKNLTKSQNMYVSLSLEELNRTQLIVDDFLSLARPHKQEYELIYVSKSLGEVIEFLRPYSMISSVDFNVKIQDGLKIHGDINEFKQLIINIVKNGIESMPEGGMLEFKAYSTHEEIVIKIKDEGIGISKEQLDLIGQPYYSTKTKGTGLGLMISLDILKRMNGKMKIDSKEGSGSCFTLIFPLIKED